MVGLIFMHYGECMSMGSGSLGSGSWQCPNCGNTLRSDQLKCPLCGKKYKLDPVFSHTEYEAPPVDQWKEELERPLTYSSESMQEVLAESEKRAKKAKRATKKKRFGIF